MKKFIILGCLLGTILLGFTMKLNMETKRPVLNHIALYVVNLEKSTAFYRDIVQIDTIPEPFHDGKHTWFSVGPYSHLHIISGAKKAKVHDKNTHLCFSVPSIEDFITRLEKAKIPYENWVGTRQTFNVRVDGVKQIYLQDPDGYWVEINNDKY